MEHLVDLLEEDEAGYVFVLRIALREVPPDVTEPRRAEQGIADRVRQDIGIGVPHEAQLISDLHPAQDELSVRGEAMKVDPDPHSDHRPILTLPSRSGQPGAAGWLL